MDEWQDKTETGARASVSHDIEEFVSSEKTLTMEARRKAVFRQVLAKVFQKYRIQRASLILKKYDVSVTSEPPAENSKICLAVDENKKIVPFTVKNFGRESVYLNVQTTELVKNIFAIRDGDGNIIGTLENHCIAPGEEFKLNIHFASDQDGFYEELLIFKFIKPDSDEFEIMYLLEVTQQAPCTVAYPPEDINLLHSLQTEKRVIYDRNSQVFLTPVVPLEKYKVPESVNNIACADRQLQESPLKCDNYSWRFHLLLYLEEHGLRTKVEKFNQKNVLVVTHRTEKDILVVTISDVTHSIPEVLSGCQGLVTPLKSSEKKYTGWVQDIDEDKVYIKFNGTFPNYFNKAMRCNVAFFYHRIPLQMQHRAVELVNKHMLDTFLFPTEECFHHQQRPRISVTSKSVADNPEQCKAIEHIVACSAKPAPYLVFGPPGTGKTVTLVQAIRQSLETHGCNILVCAPSNSATDHLCGKILEEKLGTDKVFRLYPISFPVRRIPQSVLMNCNLNPRTNAIEIPAKAKLMSYKILVTTLQTVGRLVTGGIPPGHYSYIFVDEAGQATEPECLIPISGLMQLTECQVVLAGDPKQLGPVVISKIADTHGFGVSMLERLMRDISLYKPHKITGFNGHYVTKLLRNYRSHPAILKIPNELFYEGELQPCANLEKCFYKTWTCLYRKDFPVIFHGVAGTKQRENNSPSLFNMVEVGVLKEYLKYIIKHLHDKGVDSIGPQEIGIIAPYRKQVEKIQKSLQTDRELMEENLENILVGTVEKFQGKEFNVILVSTVRSNPKITDVNQNISLGFVSNEKRFNVALTRARALLIVVGDPRVLKTDFAWNKFVHYCLEESSHRDITLLDAEDDKLATACLPSPW